MSSDVSFDPDDPIDLHHHGDRDVAPGLRDLAVNVRSPGPPDWLRERLVAGAARWGGYPDAAPARAAIAAAHGIPESWVLPTAGAAEAFGLVARAVPARRAVVVHPQFTEPEAALRAAGRAVARHLLSAADGFRLDPATVDPAADLVVIGNPTNPTSVLHPAEALRELARPARVLVVDEAFLDAVPGQPQSLLGADLPGLIVLRSLTKTWGLAGIRAGYAAGHPSLLARLAEQQPPWSVSAPAVEALVACLEPAARAEAAAYARQVTGWRDLLVAELAVAGFHCVPEPRAPFVLLDTSRLGPRSVRSRLAARGFAVRRGETFPGLGASWIRVAVREPATSLAFVAALGTLADPA